MAKSANEWLKAQTNSQKHKRIAKRTNEWLKAQTDGQKDKRTTWVPGYV